MPFTRCGQNHRYCRQAYKGANGVHYNEEAEERLQKDHPKQTGLHPSADRSIRVLATATVTICIVVRHEHRIELYTVFLPPLGCAADSLGGPFEITHLKPGNSSC